ncbi:MAG: glycosyltransferase-like protein [Bryobacterales bacterium]|nr:glycosyltransferase-like protein [Bryobacterales bacterium]
MTPEPEIPDVAQPHRVSVVVVTHNRAELLRRSLTALGAGHQVLVVDNGSSDASISLEAEFPAVRFIRLPRNFGLTKAMNVGARSADGSFLLFLHDDTVISGDAVNALADFLENRSDAGAVCPLLTDESGAPVRQARPLPTPGQPDPPFAPASGTGDEIVVPCVSGAALMLRMSFYKSLREVDDRFGTYGSDAELSAQVKRANRKLVILRNVTAIHFWAKSPVKASVLGGDRAHGTAAFLGKHDGVAAGMLYRLKTGLGAVATFRFSVMAGAFSGAKIDGSS